jgi:hypothetical protein
LQDSTTDTIPWGYQGDEHCNIESNKDREHATGVAQGPGSVNPGDIIMYGGEPLRYL